MKSGEAQHRCASPRKSSRQAGAWGTRVSHTPTVARSACHPRVQGRTERMSADERFGVLMRCWSSPPCPSPASLESLR